MRALNISHLYPLHYDLQLGIAMHKQIKATMLMSSFSNVICPIPWSRFPVRYLTPKWKAYSEVPNHEVVDGVEVLHPRYMVFPRALFRESSGLRMYHGIRKIVKQIYKASPFDLIHAHMAMPDGFAGMLLAQDFGLPLVVTLQATDLDITAKRNARCLRSLRTVFEAADRVISPSPRISSAMHGQFGIASTTIGYGVSAADICSEYSDLGRRYKDRKVLLSVSRLMPTKGIALNLYSLRRLLDHHEELVYVILGDGPARHDLERLTRELMLDDHVEFIGHVSHRQAMEYMSICDVFSMPSWQETFGLVYIEAMAHAKPVVAIQGQGVDGIVEHGKSGLLVKPRDIDSLVAALDYLLSNSGEARAIGERARKLVLENYTWEGNAAKTIKVYEEVLIAH